LPNSGLSGFPPNVGGLGGQKTQVLKMDKVYFSIFDFFPFFSSSLMPAVSPTSNLKKKDPLKSQQV
jgi:hypothetical protein